MILTDVLLLFYVFFFFIVLNGQMKKVSLLTLCIRNRLHIYRERIADIKIMSRRKGGDSVTW